MKKFFEEPMVEVMSFSVEDVVTASVEEDPVMIPPCL